MYILLYVEFGLLTDSAAFVGVVAECTIVNIMLFKYQTQTAAFTGLAVHVCLVGVCCKIFCLDVLLLTFPLN